MIKSHPVAYSFAITAITLLPLTLGDAQPSVYLVVGTFSLVFNLWLWRRNGFGSRNIDRASDLGDGMDWQKTVVGLIIGGLIGAVLLAVIIANAP
jgi:hypothetical protein